MLGHTIGTVKRNHALEHATISLLAGKLGRTLRVVGRSTNSGFYIYGNVGAEDLEEATREALVRLRRGEDHLAISPMCGTNLAVAGILAGVASLLALGSRSRIERVPNVVLASMLAVLAAQPLGRLAQRHLTTDPDLSDTDVVRFSERGFGRGRYYKVETARSR